LRSQHGTQIADTDLHSVRSGAFGLTGDVDCWPTEHECDRGVDAEGCKEGSDIGDAGFLRRMLIGYQDYIADDGDSGGNSDEDSPFLVFLGKDGPEYREDSRASVRWDGEELGVRSRPSHVLDNSWEK